MRLPRGSQENGVMEIIDMEAKAAALLEVNETTSPSIAAPSEPEKVERSSRSDPLVKRKRTDNHDQNQIESLSSEEAVGVNDGSGIVGEGLVSDRDSLWKTSLCSFFRRSAAGVCRHGNACRFAHGEAELRLRPDNSWDPTSERAKKLLKRNAGDATVGAVEKEVDVHLDLTVLDKCLIGLPRKWASDKLKSFLDDLEISYNTAKKKKGMTVGFVSFQNAHQIKIAMEVLKEKSSISKQIKVADAVHRSQDKKHKMDNSKNSSNIDDRSCHASSIVIQDGFVGTSIVTKTKNVRDVVTPLAYMSYIDQLEYKKNSLVQTLKRLTRNARKACPNQLPLPEWVLKSREIGGLPCIFEGVLESPLIDGYRNKCEFSVGYSLEGKKTVGFMLGNFREGMTAVEEPVTCPNVSRISCKYARIFQDFLQASELPVWNRIDNSGFWRQFTVREGKTSRQVAPNESVDTGVTEVMLIIQVCSLSFEEQIKNEFNRIAHALAHGAAAYSPPLPLSAIVVQDHKGISNAAPADCPLITLQIPDVDGCSDPEMVAATEARIHDYICNLRFSISPTAFFQVNTFAAETLYNLAGEWAELNEDTLLFDICCGTGTIGLSLAHRVGMVVGIEMNESAISDANRNAAINGIKNCRFICGKAEDVIGAILKEYLDVPQQHGVLSDDSGSKGAHNVGNEANETSNYEDHDEAAEYGVVAANGSMKEVLLCPEGRAMEKIAYSTKNIIDKGSSEQPISGTDDLADSIKICMEEDTGASLDNEFCRGSFLDSNNFSGTDKDSVKCFNQSQENILLGETKVANAAPVYQFKRVVAIVDPPRVGLHPIVIKALRTHPRINRLVYISCNPESLVANAIELCTPTADNPEKGKGNRGWRNMSNAGLARYRVKSMPSSEPFRPVRAMAVDMFPHTPHCEMVMVLER